MALAQCASFAQKRFMKTLTLFFITVCSTAFSQAKYEVQEFTGTIKGIQPGWNFALEVIQLQVGNEVRFFRLDPVYGKSILSRIKEGQAIALKANVNLTVQESLKKLRKNNLVWMYRFMDQIVEIKIDNEWTQTPSQPQEIGAVREMPSWKVFLEQKVEGDYFLDGFRKGLIFNNGLVAFAAYNTLKFNSMASIKPGKKVSFTGYASPVKEEFLYPIQNVKRVYTYIELTKLEGQIESYVYKQNYVRIGLVVKGKRLSFPAERARDIEKLGSEKIAIYFEGIEDKESNLLPTIHAIVHQRDTLFFQGMYYGGPDGKHEHQDVQVEGTITKVNRTDKGRIMSLILGKDCYIEIDPQMDSQLGDLLKKGTFLKVSGEERVKKEGEIYEKEFRIITPKRIMAEQKEFIINQ
jgi:hypothetical protein